MPRNLGDSADDVSCCKNSEQSLQEETVYEKMEVVGSFPLQCISLSPSAITTSSSLGLLNDSLPRVGAQEEHQGEEGKGQDIGRNVPNLRGY